MKIEIIGTESLGVRSMCCFVETKNRKALFDPGIALGYTRHGLLPHPYQVAVDERIQKKIIKKWSEATDIVISHFHEEKKVDVFIIDHHLMRSTEGETWLERLSSNTGKKIICGADFMGKSRKLLEARRRSLYKDMPVAENWHEMYSEGRTKTDYYLKLAGEIYK